MGIVIFVLGAIIFLVLGILVVYWNFDELSPKDCFYRSIISIYLMGLIVFLYLKFGENIFGINAQNWIVSIISIVLLLFIVLYVFFYCVLDEWKYKLLTLLPFLGMQIYQIIESNVLLVLFSNNSYVIALVSVIVTISSLIYSNYYRKKSQRIESIHTKYMRSHSDLPFELYEKNIDFSGNMSDDISFFILKIYNLAQEGRLSPSKLNDFLSRNESTIPASMKNRVLERFLDSPYLNAPDSLNLLEFATVLFPEFYGNYSKTHRSEKYDLRIFDEFYSLVHHNMSKEHERFIKLEEKIEKLTSIIENTSYKSNYIIQDNAENIPISNDTTLQTVLKEIHHLTKTPLQTIKYAVNNLSNGQERELSDSQKEKISTILNNVLTVKMIIEAYKKLVFFSDVTTNEDVLPYLQTAISSLGERKKIKGEFINFPNEKICVHGNNVLVILLLPLIHNAIEASPENDKIIVSCSDIGKNYTICIENHCTTLPNQKDLNTDGFSTRTDTKGGVGLMSVRRISASIGIKFDIKVYNKTNKVIARLIIPKK